MVDERRVSVALTDLERQVLVAAMGAWGGPARPTQSLVQAMGFEGLAGFSPAVRRLAEALGRREALTPEDWRRALCAFEVVFASDIVGSGSEWSTITGYSDIETIAVLRSLQRKLPRR